MANLFTEIAGWFTGLFTKQATGPKESADAGPADDEHPLVPVLKLVQSAAGLVQPGRDPQLLWPPTDAWEHGFWVHATKVPAHPGRVGPSIVPQTVVVHTTDCMPGSMSTIVRSWATAPGEGNGAHFIIGRDEKAGVVQLVPVTRNGNHAGGRPKHGWYKMPSGALIHPNTCSVGIELDCAGKLRWRPAYAAAIHPDTGREIPMSDVYVDKLGYPWHVCTDWQLRTLCQLLTSLRQVLHPTPPGLTVQPDGEYVANGVAWAASPTWSPVIVGHATLDPVNKTDPGPQVLDYIRENLK